MEAWVYVLCVKVFGEGGCVAMEVVSFEYCSSKARGKAKGVRDRQQFGARGDGSKKQQNSTCGAECIDVVSRLPPPNRPPPRLLT